MKIHEIDLLYKITGLEPRRRLPSTHIFHDKITVNVPTVEDYDAPICLTVKDENTEENFRYYNEKWYLSDRPLNSENKNSGSIRTACKIGVEKNTLNKLDMSNNSILNAFLYSIYQHDFINGEGRREEDAFRSITDNTKELDRNTITEFADNHGLISINGILYVEIPEPEITLKFNTEHFSYTNKNSENIELKMSIDKDKFRIIPFSRKNNSYDIEEPSQMTFNASQLDEVDSICDYITQTESINVISDLELELKNKELIQPLPHTQEKNYLIKEAKNWHIHDMLNLYKKDRETIIAYIDFRDAFLNAKETKYAESDLNKISETLREYGNHRDIGTYTRIVLNRWDQRPISLDIDFDEYIPHTP